MFFREKKSENRSYLQIVENRWEDGKSKQRVITTLGRLDKLREEGELDTLLQSGARFSEKLLVLSGYRKGEATEISTFRIGSPMIFERLWQETGCAAALKSFLHGRKFGFDVERVVFLTVLHRLVAHGSDRAGEKWRQKYRIDGLDNLDLHHCYRAMGWLGDALEDAKQPKGTGFAPRCTKDLIEEDLFQRRRDLFTSFELVFFDTTSIYFEGKGGDTIGEYGKSKDHRSDRRQMVVGVVLDDEGRPVCSEMWPGNVVDVTSLVPIVDRLRERFSIDHICIVADRGMISAKTIRELEGREWKYILGARMRKVKEIKREVLSRGGRYHVVRPKGQKKKDPSPLKIKEVFVEDRRYVVCFNEDQAKKDAFDREAIIAALEEQLKKGSKSLVGNRGYRKYLKAVNGGFVLDREQAEVESRYDGKWVLQTNTSLDASGVALKYKQLWMVEQIFRSMKSLLETRPIYHKRDETIRGHVFCSFLAIVLMQELQTRLDAKGHTFEWDDVINDLDELEEIEIMQDEKRFLLRSEAQGVCGKVFQSVGVAMPPTVRQVV